jgi:hypothetical protein
MDAPIAGFTSLPPVPLKPILLRKLMQSRGFERIAAEPEVPFADLPSLPSEIPTVLEILDHYSILFN